MKKEPSKILFTLGGALIFNFIFWQEKPGINIILFDVFICSAIAVLSPYSLKNSNSRWLLAMHIATAAMVLIQNTLLSEVGFVVTLLLFASFSQYHHRSIWYATGSSMLNYLLAVPNFFRELMQENNSHESKPTRLRSFRVFLIPIAIVGFFIIIYSSANNVFSGILLGIVTSITNWLAHFFDWFPLERFVFFFLGIIVVSGLLLRNKRTYFSDRDMKRKNNLSRTKTSYKKWKESVWVDLLSIVAGKASAGLLALKHEFKSGLLSLVLLNVLLCIINCIDIKYVWLSSRFSKSAGMAAYVHEGAWLLIFSIILAMLVLLFFFRGNLNFYKKNKWLRYGAYIWILQNSFLVLSVFSRDYFYIAHYGLAYKRIGLLFFLTMVLGGLITVYLKIYYTKTIYFLLKINAWIGLVLLVSASTVNWDIMMVRYNLSRQSTIPLDVPFLLSLSDQTLPLIQKNKEVLEKTPTASYKYYYNGAAYNAAEFFELRKKTFLIQQKNYSWLSWNIADASTKKELTGNINYSFGYYRLAPYQFLWSLH